MFKVLRDVRVSPLVKRSVRAHLTDLTGKPRRFRGQVLRQEVGYIFVDSKEYGRALFCHESSVAPERWAEIEPFADVTYEIGFTFRGPTAVNVSSA